MICVRVRGLALVHQVEEMSLVVRTRGVCSTNSLVADAAGLRGETAASISLAGLVLVLSMAASLRAVPILPSVALSQLRHEVPVEHRLPHLRCLLSLRKLVVLAPRVETTHSRLVEHLLLVQLVHVWKHLVDTRVIRRLKHNPCLSGVHLVYAQRSVALALVPTTLLPHAVCHEERLVRLLGTETTLKLEIR